MTDAHFANFIAAIHGQEKLNSPIPVANVTVTMLLLSNIAWFVDRKLHLDTRTAISDDAEAMKYWGRIRAGLGSDGLANHRLSHSDVPAQSMWL